MALIALIVTGPPVHVTRRYNDVQICPIWITELSIHVAYDGWQIVDGKIQPVGTYHWDNMAGYLIAVLDWLEANADVMLIEKWFAFISWKDVVNVGPSGYMGIILFDDPNVGAGLTCLGELYKARALADSKVTCDAVGNTVPE